MFALKGDAGKTLLDRWLAWARRCRIPAFVDLAARIARHRDAIDASLEHRLSNERPSHCTFCRGCDAANLVGLLVA